MKMWKSMLQGIALLRAADPKFGRPAWAARALIGMGDDRATGAFLNRISTMYPQDPEVDLWRARGERHLGNYPKCEAAARMALQKNERFGRPLSNELLATAHFELYEALLNQAKLDEAENELKLGLALTPNDSSRVHAERVLANARLHKFVFSRVYQETIPLGIYHLYSSRHRRTRPGRQHLFASLADFDAESTAGVDRREYTRLHPERDP